MAKGKENLIPMDKRSEDEVRELGRKGGVASGAARRRKKSLKEAADLYLSLPVSDKRKRNKIIKRMVDPEDADNQMAMIIGLVEAATAGDARAGRLIVELLGDDIRAEQAGRENNLLEILQQINIEIDTDDLPETE